MNKKHCKGCYCDDYNHGLGGAQECWSFKNARLIMRTSRGNSICSIQKETQRVPAESSRENFTQPKV